MKEETAKAMVERFNKVDGKKIAALYDNYSGKRMKGTVTTGVVIPTWARPDKTMFKVAELGKKIILY